MKMEKHARVAHEVHVRAKLNELYDFDKFTELQRKVIDELGCTACTSGVNLRFDIERFFGKFRKGEIDRIALSEVGGKVVDVRVTAPREVVNDFKLNVAARRAVLRELGCDACTSGHNIIFEDELSFAVDHNAEVVNLG